MKTKNAKGLRTKPAAKSAGSKFTRSDSRGAMIEDAAARAVCAEFARCWTDSLVGEISRGDIESLKEARQSLHGVLLMVEGLIAIRETNAADNATDGE